MKKLIVFTLLSASFFSNGQSKYISVSAGYGIGVPGNPAIEVTEYSNGLREETLKHVNFGGGLLVDVAYGVPVNKIACFELALGYQNNLGSTLESVYYSEERNSANQLIETRDYETRTINSSSFRFAPGFRFMAGEGKTRGFVKVAPQVIVAKVSGTYEFDSDKRNIQSADEYSRSVSFGFLAGLGFESNISERIIFVSSINGNLGYYSPSEWNLVKYEYNGEDVLPQIPLSEKQTYYSKELDVNPNGQSSITASREFKTRMDYSSVSLNIGLRFLL